MSGQLEKWAARRGTALAIPYSSFLKRWARSEREFNEMTGSKLDELRKFIHGHGNLPAWRNYWGEKVLVPRGWGYNQFGRLADFISPIPMLETSEGISSVAKDDVLSAFSNERFAPDAAGNYYKSVKLKPEFISKRR